MDTSSSKQTRTLNPWNDTLVTLVVLCPFWSTIKVYLGFRTTIMDYSFCIVLFVFYFV